MRYDPPTGSGVVSLVSEKEWRELRLGLRARMSRCLRHPADQLICPMGSAYYLGRGAS